MNQVQSSKRLEASQELAQSGSQERQQYITDALAAHDLKAFLRESGVSKIRFSPREQDGEQVQGQPETRWAVDATGRRLSERGTDVFLSGQEISLDGLRRLGYESTPDGGVIVETNELPGEEARQQLVAERDQILQQDQTLNDRGRHEVEPGKRSDVAMESREPVQTTRGELREKVFRGDWDQISDEQKVSRLQGFIAQKQAQPIPERLTATEQLPANFQSPVNEATTNITDTTINTTMEVD